MTTTTTTTRTARTLSKVLTTTLCTATLATCLAATGGTASAAESSSTANHAYGAKLGPSSADNTAYLRSHTSGTLPSSANLTAYAMTPGSQGQVGSCVAWAISYGMVGWYANKAGIAGPPFAPMFTYTQVNHGVDNGSLPTDALSTLVTNGVDTQADYWQGNYDWQTQPTAAEFTNAASYKISGFDTLFAQNRTGDTAIASLKTALAGGQPVAITMAVRPGFDEYTPNDGYAVDSDTTGGIEGYHEVLALGYDDRGLLIENSWGTDWSPTGMRFLSWDVVAQDVLEAETMRGLAGSGAQADTTAPSVSISAPIPMYLGRAGTSTVPVTFKWSVADASAIQTLSAYLKYDGAWHQLSAAAGTRVASYTLTTGKAYQLAVRAQDAAGNWSSWTYGRTFTPTLVQNTSTSVTRGGTWGRYSSTSYSGGSQDTSGVAGATATVHFTGQAFAWDAARATNRGQARVWLDGTYLGVVDTGATSTSYATQVLTRAWTTSAAHTLQIQVLGTSGRPYVDLDAVSVLQ